MKKAVKVTLTLILAVVLCTGCTAIEKQPRISNEYVLEEDGLQYLVLPISKQKVLIWEDSRPFIEKIDLEMLTAAEEKINAQTRNSENPAGFCLKVKDGHIYLSAEIIETIDPPKTKITEEGYVVEGGCDIDHKHTFFTESITK